MKFFRIIYFFIALNFPSLVKASELQLSVPTSVNQGFQFSLSSLVSQQSDEEKEGYSLSKTTSRLSDLEEELGCSPYKTGIYIISPLPFEGENPLYTEKQLQYISGMVHQLKTLFSQEDWLICPGRSCIHFSDILKREGYHIASPSFSKGHNVLGCLRLSEHEGQKTNEKKLEELQEELKQFPAEDMKHKSKLLSFLTKFDDLPFYVDFETQEIKSSQSFIVSRKQIAGYRQYLMEKWGISPKLMGQTRGNIILFDSVCSGGGMGGFLKIILDWCQEEGVDIAAKIKIANFNYRERETPIFETNNPLSAYWHSMLYFLIPKPIWKNFSYNKVQTQSAEHFFFPPWTWEQKQLWVDLPLDKL